MVQKREIQVFWTIDKILLSIYNGIRKGADTAMHLEQLRYFLSVARHRNFTEAAREFYMTQPAITHQISALERELGAKLFLAPPGTCP